MPDENVKINKTEENAILKMCSDMVAQKNRDNRHMFIALIISLIMNICIVGAFLIYESQFEYTDTTTVERTVTEYEQDTKGDESDIVNGNQYNDSATHTENK